MYGCSFIILSFSRGDLIFSMEPGYAFNDDERGYVFSGNCCGGRCLKLQGDGGDIGNCPEESTSTRSVSASKKGGRTLGTP